MEFQCQAFFEGIYQHFAVQLFYAISRMSIEVLIKGMRSSLTIAADRDDQKDTERQESIGILDTFGCSK